MPKENYQDQLEDLTFLLASPQEQKIEQNGKCWETLFWNSYVVELEDLIIIGVFVLEDLMFVFRIGRPDLYWNACIVELEDLIFIGIPVL